MDLIEDFLEAARAQSALEVLQYCKQLLIASSGLLDVFESLVFSSYQAPTIKAVASVWSLLTCSSSKLPQATFKDFELGNPFRHLVHLLAGKSLRPLSLILQGEA